MKCVKYAKVVHTVGILWSFYIELIITYSYIQVTDDETCRRAADKADQEMLPDEEELEKNKQESKKVFSPTVKFSLAIAVAPLCSYSLFHIVCVQGFFLHSVDR